MNNNEYVQIVESAILKFLVEVSTNPLAHFSEKSLQVRLAAMLLKNSKLSQPVPTGIAQRPSYLRKLELMVNEELADRNRDLLSNYHAKLAFSIPPLQMEYGCGGGRRLDLAILSPQAIGEIVNTQFQTECSNYVKPLIGIELGTEKTGWSGMDKHLTNDGKKLSQCHHGYSISVMRDRNFARRSNDSYTEKQNTIKRFKRAQEKVAAKRFDGSITWIGLIVNIALGEVELFTTKNEWQTIDLLTEDMKKPLRQVLRKAI